MRVCAHAHFNKSMSKWHKESHIINFNLYISIPFFSWDKANFSKNNLQALDKTTYLELPKNNDNNTAILSKQNFECRAIAKIRSSLAESKNHFLHIWNQSLKKAKENRRM